MGAAVLGHVGIMDGNLSNFWFGFGFLQKSVKKNGFSTDCGFLEFSGLRIFGLRILEIFL